MSQYDFPNLTTTQADSNHFTGTVQLGEIASSTDGRRVRFQKVDFAPASRTHWHRHSAEQVLVVLDGTCVLKCSGGSAVHIRPGESASIPAGTVHWHGSTPACPMAHLALNLGGETRWLDRVAEPEYEMALAEAGAGGRRQLETPRRETAGDSENTVVDHLRDKLKSKMEVAKFFTGFITLFVGIMLDADRLSSPLAKFGTVSFVLSLGFCVAAMFIYDHLLWPSRYWKGSDTESFHSRLSKEMVGAWRWLFIPAVGFFGGGVVLVLAQELGQNSSSDLVWVRVFITLVVAVMLPTLICCFRWPRNVGPQ